MKLNSIFKSVQENILISIKNLKLKNTDNVYLGISIGGVFQNYYKELFSERNSNINLIRESAAKLVFTTLTEYFKNGALIVPTFYFDYFKKKKFNLKTTSTTLGYFEKYFLKQKKIVRSNHPIFSISAYGRNKKKFIYPCGPFSFGVNSPFNNFVTEKVKFLNLGVKFKNTCTYVHHVEHMNGVNHRYYKAVNGKVLIGKNYKNKTFYSLVRFHSLKSSKAEYKIEGILKKKKLLLEKNKNGLYSSRVDSSDLYKCTLEQLIKEPSFFMTKKTIVELE